ncbi:glycosyltransferase [Providencia rettgeri]|uniref:glycosyltransferase n=1 Tax=Providencia rettgeri TaxID=587 RepID=UPI0022200839|nr:glycosyltransferase [Providencia rettgeri]ELR5279296.1 glycosyltransferase [Providencia rettgeri]ELU1436642.1 glycosyltransferase [Providencia rettgeri]UYV41605.1 glycosyltransferase [Providencia rettgeri]
MYNFSVLMSVYKSELPSAFNNALSSILKDQSVKPNEVIIIKDGPLTPELNHIIDEWVVIDSFNIKVISLPKNVGLGNALNIGMLHCKYDWVFRMDTDDYCTPDRFKKQLEFIQKNPKIALVGSSTEEFDIYMLKPLGLRRVPCKHDEIKQYIKRRNPFNHMTVAFRKDVIESVGGYQHHLYMEDYNLWIRVIAAGHQVGNIDEVLVNVRGGDSMVKRRKGLVYIKSELQLAKLKIEKKIDSPINAYTNFIIRSIPRLLPTYMLSKIYKNLRK